MNVSGTPRNLSREEVYRVFEAEQELKIDAGHVLMNVPAQELFHAQYIQLVMMEDEIYNRFGIEKEEYNLLLGKYRLIEDEQVQERIRDVEELLEPVQ